MYISTTSSHNRVDGLFYLLLGGPIALVWGLRKLNEKRLIQNTPMSKVRSAAMGLVELQGLARWKAPEKSPFSNMSTCWWRCEIQELRSNGKSSSWYTIKEMNSNTIFYLEDMTGRVLLNPLGAELHVPVNTYELNAMTRTHIAPVLIGWGINDMNWLGGEKRLRILEHFIPDQAPLFIMGELVSIAAGPEDRRAKFMARLREIKADPAKMAEADSNHDGTVDAEEWSAFEAKLEEDFNREQMQKESEMPNADKMMVKAPAHAPFVVSTQEEQSLINSFNWLAPLGIFGGIVLSALGVWWAIAMDWPPLMIVGLLAGGFLLSLFRKTSYLGLRRN